MPLEHALAALPLEEPRRLFTELGLSPFAAWGRASIGRLDEQHAILVVTVGRSGNSGDPVRVVADLCDPWPHALAGFVMDWLGPVRPADADRPLAAPWLRVNLLTIEGWRRRVYEPTSRIQVEIRWHPERGED